MFKQLAVTATTVAVMLSAPAQAGSFSINPLKTVTVHSYTSNHGSNSHIIESADSLTLLDFSSDPQSAQELSDYLDRLDKPITKVIVSHVHGDGQHHTAVPAAAAKAPIYTFANTKSELEQLGLYPKAQINVLKPGEQLTNGIKANFSVGAGDTVTLSMPTEGLLWSHHSMYIGFHLPDLSGQYLAMVENYSNNGYQLYIGGHGKVGGPKAPQVFANYQRFCAEAVKSSVDAAEAKAKIVAQYPDWQGDFMLDMILPHAYK
ncbi:MBL fold metallo-hydrolase [Ferrimonas lipolytica]|uniref:MBL fold metallo-hydrolase n=1 Tax=Ferrimonas lipolytica TaxID=2724191 RepID=A0A6H1UGH1_9GAMM|nr:MBL fold metallo-hydrolase [Ferrimonas lipolytica]QIZ78144.1 MBL fold metallo-hydrolase [Ferrimonas lipolytica]